MLIVAKKTEEDLADWLASEVGFVSGLCMYEDKPFRLEAYQRAFLKNKSRFRWVNKSRQIGYSMIFALEGLARCHLRESHNALYVSHWHEDAKEKILVARQIYDDLPLAYQKRLVTDSKTELSFASNKSARKVSRMISHPSKAPRGKKGDIYLDEIAHYMNDREVYSGSTALILRAKGQLTGASTPLGRRGIFWEISEQVLRPYPHHRRAVVPWWLCSFYCTDVLKASRQAPMMLTEERVERFGTPAIRMQLESMPVDDFKQEFECDFSADEDTVFPYELLLPCTHSDLSMATDFMEVPKPRGKLVAGFDVGRTRDRSELALFEDVDGRKICRMLKSYANVPFAIQEKDLRRMLEALPIHRLSIDKGGIGMNLAENLCYAYPHCCAGEDFTNESKARWVTDFKIALQRREVDLPADRMLVSQIHSIEKKVLPSGKLAYKAKRTASGHADRAWAIMLACQKERWGVTQLPSLGLRVIG